MSQINNIIHNTFTYLETFDIVILSLHTQEGKIIALPIFKNYTKDDIKRILQSSACKVPIIGDSLQGIRLNRTPDVGYPQPTILC